MQDKQYRDNTMLVLAVRWVHSIEEIDFASCFNSIPRGKLMEIVGKRISDKRFVRLLKCFLKAGVLEQSGTLKLKGRHAYYGFVTNLTKLNHFYYSVRTALFKWLNRRSQRESFSGKSFQAYLRKFQLAEPPVMSNLKSLGWCLYV